MALPQTPPPGTLIINDPSTHRPRPRSSLGMDVWHVLCRIFLRLGGWKVACDWPAVPRMVITAGPHTSNWDGIWMIAAAGAWRIRLRYMGKASLTRGPLGWAARWSGCIPVDRASSNDVVSASIAAFDAADDLILVVAPEGTRDAVQKWKSGFYHIAAGAGVPIATAVMDYATRTVSLSILLWPSGDYAKDLPIIQQAYASARGKNHHNFILTGQ